MEKLKQYYKLLGIPPGATMEEIEHAYRAAEKQFHAERLSEDPVVRHRSQQRLKKLNEAYLGLMDTYQEVRTTLREGDSAMEPQKPADAAQEIAAAEKRAGGKEAATPPLPAAAGAVASKAKSTSAADTPDTIHPGSDEPDTTDPIALLRKESLFLLTVAAIILSVMAFRWISSRKTPAPTAPAATSAPAAPATTAVPAATSAPVTVAPRIPLKQDEAASHPSPKLEGNGSSNAQVVRQDAEQGNDKAQAFLGYMYLTGKGVQKDRAAAVQWFHKAAVQGNAEAQNWLGHFYETGTGVPKDYMEAVRWYRLAAEQGYAEAQKNLGLKYLKGKGVTRNGHEGIKWLRKAAAQGNEEARRSLEIWKDE